MFCLSDQSSQAAPGHRWTPAHRGSAGIRRCPRQPKDQRHRLCRYAPPPPLGCKCVRCATGVHSSLAGVPCSAHGSLSQCSVQSQELGDLSCLAGDYTPPCTPLVHPRHVSQHPFEAACTVIPAGGPTASTRRRLDAGCARRPACAGVKRTGTLARRFTSSGSHPAQTRCIPALSLVATRNTHRWCTAHGQSLRKAIPRAVNIWGKQGASGGVR